MKIIIDHTEMDAMDRTFDSHEPGVSGVDPPPAPERLVGFSREGGGVRAQFQYGPYRCIAVFSREEAERIARVVAASL